MSRPPIYSRRDVATMFGYASAASFSSSVYQGCFPPADYKIPNHRGAPCPYWSLDTILRERKRREEKRGGR